MKYANMKQIPNGCILRRWTIGAMENVYLDEDSIVAQEDDLSITGHEGNKRKLFGIGDPKFVVAKGAPKGKKRRICTKCHNAGHNQRTCPTMSASKRPECYLHKPQNHDWGNNSNFARDVLMRLQPYAYIKGELQQVK